jgi:hypothetical protein
MGAGLAIALGRAGDVTAAVIDQAAQRQRPAAQRAIGAVIARGGPGRGFEPGKGRVRAVEIALIQPGQAALSRRRARPGPTAPMSGGSISGSPATASAWAWRPRATSRRA